VTHADRDGERLDECKCQQMKEGVLPVWLQGSLWEMKITVTLFCLLRLSQVYQLLQLDWLLSIAGGPETAAVVSVWKLCKSHLPHPDCHLELQDHCHQPQFHQQKGPLLSSLHTLSIHSLQCLGWYYWGLASGSSHHWVRAVEEIEKVFWGLDWSTLLESPLLTGSPEMNRWNWFLTSHRYTCYCQQWPLVGER